MNVIKALLKDNRLVPGAGATEVELAKRIEGVWQQACEAWRSTRGETIRDGAWRSSHGLSPENALGGTEGNEVVSRCGPNTKRRAVR